MANELRVAHDGQIPPDTHVSRLSAGEWKRSMNRRRGSAVDFIALRLCILDELFDSLIEVGQRDVSLDLSDEIVGEILWKRLLATHERLVELEASSKAA